MRHEVTFHLTSDKQIPNFNCATKNASEYKCSVAICLPVYLSFRLIELLTQSLLKDPQIRTHEPFIASERKSLSTYSNNTIARDFCHAVEHNLYGL